FLLAGCLITADLARADDPPAETPAKTSDGKDATAKEETAKEPDKAPAAAESSAKEPAATKQPADEKTEGPAKHEPAATQKTAKPADTGKPVAFDRARQWLELFNVHASYFDHILDGREVDESESEALLRMLYAVRKFPLLQIHRLESRGASWQKW